MIGTPDPDAVYDVCDRVEAAIGRPVNPAILTREESQANSGFLASVRANPMVPIVGVAWSD